MVMVVGSFFTNKKYIPDYDLIFLCNKFKG